jgi:diguanylate cyclase (GGDEF)-like protein
VLTDTQTEPRPDPDRVRSAHQDSVQVRSAHQDLSSQAALRHTLAILRAGSQDELLHRTLAAAVRLTGASAAALIGPGGPIQTYGDDAHTLRWDPATPRIGGPERLVAEFGDRWVVLVAAEGRSLRTGARSVLDLLLAHARAASDRLREVEQLTHRANRDPLTGLHHHRPFAQRLSDSRPGHTAVITLDVDRFKKINDEYGHEAGNHALVSLVDALRSALRDADELYRIGGDEFAVVVDVNGPAEAVAVARRLLAAARRVGQTVSAGAALNAPGETGRQTLVRADRALYEAKRAGRDRARLAA